VLRGGSWNNNDTNLRGSNRNRNDPGNRNNNNGFRAASSPWRLRSLVARWRAFTDSRPVP